MQAGSRACENSLFGSSVQIMLEGMRKKRVKANMCCCISGRYAFRGWGGDASSTSDRSMYHVKDPTKPDALESLTPAYTSPAACR